MMLWRRTKQIAHQPWSRTRTLAALVGAGLLCLSLVTTAVYGLVLIIMPAPVAQAVDGQAQLQPQTTVPVAGETPEQTMDRIAAASMAQPGMTAMFEGEPAITKAAEILIPEPGDEFGPGGVVTGFPHTPEGAVAQLAVIETEVLTTMCVDITKEIHEGWVQKGGPSFEAWEMTQAVRGFLAGLNQGRCKDSAVQISVDPVAGIIKGTVGQDWVLACVLLDFTAAKSDSKRFGYGHCARMAWVDDRWQVAAGKPPADAPSALPDTQAAVDAGWLSWTNVALGG